MTVAGEIISHDDSYLACGLSGRSFPEDCQCVAGHAQRGAFLLSGTRLSLRARSSPPLLLSRAVSPCFSLLFFFPRLLLRVSVGARLSFFRSLVVLRVILADQTGCRRTLLLARLCWSWSHVLRTRPVDFWPSHESALDVDGFRLS